MKLEMGTRDVFSLNTAEQNEEFGHINQMEGKQKRRG